MGEIFTSGDFSFEYVENWGLELSDYEDSEWGTRKVADVGIDAEDNVYLLTRSCRPIIKASPEGHYLMHWEGKYFSRPHSISFNEKHEIYIVDDDGETVQRFDREGNLLMQIGERGVASSTGVVKKDYRTVKQAAGPFHFPTGVSEAPNGELYVSDGYGNARVHRFTHHGKLIQSWGTPGILPGQFFLPHGILATEDRVYVCDRENNRIQLFDRDGKFIEEWKNIMRPSTIRIGPEGLLYVCECKRCDIFDAAPSTLSIMDLKGNVLCRIDNRHGALPFAQYHAAHGLAVDSKGDVYIGEVGNPPKGHLGVKKYRRIR